MKYRDRSWDFVNANTKYYTHGIHTYPAMMIPQIARRLIQEYGKNARVGLDPFCGSGSVLLEFRLAEIESYGVDINPLAVLISKVKTNPLDPNLLREEWGRLKSEINKLIFEPESKIELPNFFNIEYWFKKSVIKQLAIIKQAISEIEDSNIKNFFLVCFAETVRKASNTRGSEFKLYRIGEKKLENYNPNAYMIFNEIVKKNIKGMSELYLAIKHKKDIKVIVVEGDVTKGVDIPNNSIDLLITSPPYGDSKTTVAYGQFSRLALQWLDFPYDLIKKIDKISLGGIPAKSTACNLPSEKLKSTIDTISKVDEKRAREVLAFFQDFYKGAEEINKLMKEKATMCFVVGNRTVKNVKIPTDEIIVDFFKEFNFKHIKTIVRSIPSKRMPKMNSPTNKPGVLSSTMNEENIIILKR